jgi:signal transduction histidine kinase
MNAWLIEKLGAHYILAMTLFTRVFASLGGGLCIYYVNLTIIFTPDAKRHFDYSAAAFIALAIVVTTLLSLVETQHLRRVLRDLARGTPVSAKTASLAGAEAVRYPGRHCFHEAVLDPLLIIPQICGTVWYLDQAPLATLVQIVIAGSFGIATVLLIVFFVSERLLAPIVRHLLDHGVLIPFETLPASRLHVRLNICVGLVVVVTSVMIGALANQRALDIINNPANQEAAVTNLREHIALITLVAVAVGLALSRMLANSIASRVRLMVEAMQRVQQGQLADRLQPTGADEIDTLARQFNRMVGKLENNDQTIRDLNTNLERKVKRRTRQLSKSRRTLKRSLAKLREYDRLKTEFFSNISHELRTPLTMILTPVERILERQRASLPAGAATMLEMVRVNAARLLELINKLLDFSKLEAGRMELKPAALDLNALVRDLGAAARPLTDGRGIELCVATDSELPIFAADKDKIDIVVSNLLSNAVKFTPSGGRVTLETLRTDDRAWVSVSDTGIGINEADYERIFDRFVQVDGSSSREFSGTGLGLSLAKELIDLHGGRIYVKSEVGKGTRFWFDLPLTPCADPQEVADVSTSASRRTRFADLDSCVDDEAPAQESPRDSQRELAKVLVVDDTAEMRALLGDILSEDYRVLFGRDGAEGMEATLRHLPDLIISDVMMPRVDGQEFCRRVRENPETAQIPFVLLTARAESAMKVRGLDCGADDYLTKPFDEQELKARVRSLLKLRRLHQDLDKRNRELERAYQELTSMQGQLIHSEKMSSLGQLVAGLAHEINNSINAVYNGIKPLTASTHRLQGLLSPLLAGEAWQCDEETRNDVEGIFRRLLSLAGVIQNGASRTARIIADLKTFSHPGKEDFDDFDLHESLDMCLNLLFSQVKHRISLQKDYGDVATVHGPHGHLNQVFMNILNNAQQAIESDGEITVTTRQEGDLIRVSVRDTGPGIPAEVLGRIFDPFFTTKEPGLGTGLGLSISYGIIDRLGGRIECRTGIGKGTEFIIVFPIHSCLPDESPAGRSLTGAELRGLDAPERQPSQALLACADALLSAVD